MLLSHFDYMEDVGATLNGFILTKKQLKEMS